MIGNFHNILQGVEAVYWVSIGHAGSNGWYLVVLSQYTAVPVNS